MIYSNNAECGEIFSQQSFFQPYRGYDFYTCDFEGLDTNGKPRLTIMQPGCPVKNFLEHLDIIGEDPNDYQLLCEEGKQADSRLVFEMLWQMFQNVYRPFERMTERMEQMRKCGINYDRELQRVTVRVFEYDDEETQSKSYRLIIYAGDRFVGDDCKFKDIKDIIVKLSDFFFFIENHLHIPLKKHLETSESLKKQVMHHSTNLFDEVNII